MTSPHPRRKGLFVVGTDTGVGKTVVACALLRLAARRALPLVPFKPVETGCAPDPQDAHALWEAARRPGPRAAVCLYPLPLPAAPAVAAAAADQVIDIEAIIQRADQLQPRGEALLVEGAGGLLVPYHDAVTTADLAARLNLPLLLVARNALGTINHTALTLAEITRRRLPLAGLILVDTTPSHEAQRNAQQIGILTEVEALGTLSHLSTVDPDQAADALADALGPDTIEQLLRTATQIA